MPCLFGIRTNHFDRFWTSAAADGIRQVVNLASGLDSRGYRLPCPARTIAYEIDRPEVIEFKKAVLADLGAEAKVEIQAVGVDLRDDWLAAVRAAGVRPGDSDRVDRRRADDRIPAR